jgi:tRNA(Ile)-lysidine synthase
VSASPKLLDTPYTRRTDARVLEYIRRREVFRPGESVVAGLSGGPDSTALVVILSRLQGELGLCVTAAHFDHRLRPPDEAAEDFAFATQVCRRLGAPLVRGSGNVAARARRSGETIEEAARNLRYRFLGREAKGLNAPVIAVGHTMDDRAETVLLNIVRGAGLDGLSAMPPRAPWPFGSGPEIARPLLDLKRADTERYCRESNIEPRRDPTNDLPIATRNRLRRELMPVLRSFNPRISEALSRLSDAASRDAGFLEDEARAYWDIYTSRDRDGIVFDRAHLASRHVATTSRLLRRAVGELSEWKVDLDWQHVERILASLQKRRARTPLPGGLVAVTDPYIITIWPSAPPMPPSVPHAVLNLQTEMRIGEWTFDTRLADNREGLRPTDPNEAVFDGPAVGLPLKVRSRQPGDRLRPLGLGGEKKLQDVFVDAKVPREERDGVPIVVDDRGIVWVVGHCIDERVAVTAETRSVIQMKARRVRVDGAGRAR